MIVEETEESKLPSIKDLISAIKEISFVEEKEDGSKEYKIVVENGKDIRKEISTTCAKSNIIILEMKKQETSLEDAFVNLVEGRPDYNQKEIKKMQYQKEIQELREEQEIKKAKKEEKKQQKMEKKAEKEAKNAENQSKNSNEDEKVQENQEKTSETELDKSEKAKGGEK